MRATVHRDGYKKGPVCYLKTIINFRKNIFSTNLAKILIMMTVKAVIMTFVVTMKMTSSSREKGGGGERGGGV